MQSTTTPIILSAVFNNCTYALMIKHGYDDATTLTLELFYAESCLPEATSNLSLVWFRSTEDARKYLENLQQAIENNHYTFRTHNIGTNNSILFNGTPLQARALYKELQPYSAEITLSLEPCGQTSLF